MSGILTRRRFVAGGLATAASATGVGAAIYAAGDYGLIPPDHGGILGIGKTLTYSSQRLLTSGQALAREFPRSRISRVHPTNGLVPGGDAFRRLAANGFVDWRLAVDGLVARPRSFSLDDLKRLPMESHITLHACEEGWSYIAEWTGVRLSNVLDMVGIRPGARYVVFMPFENADQNTGVLRVLWQSIDMAEALHPQTLLAYGMNGKDLPPGHGAPLRLRLARQLGYKNTKYLYRIAVIDNPEAAHDPVRRGPWYGGI
jgi:DMSO/TMAO reductase YedYZ molybdopterin-dependent catalytic subunit